MNKSLAVISVCVVALVVLSGCCADTYSDDSDTITYKSADGTTTEMDRYEHLCKYTTCLNFGSYAYNPTTELCKCYNTKGTYLYSHYFGDDCDVGISYCEDDCYYLYGSSETHNCIENCKWMYEDCDG